jgi:WD40 repeat protein
MRGRVAVLVVMAAGCGAPARGPTLRHQATCAAATGELAAWREAMADGRLHRALDHAGRADAACASSATRQALAESWDALGVDARADAAWSAYAATAGSDAGLAASRRAALRRRPPPTRAATADERATAILLYRDGVNQRLRGQPERAITQLRRSYALLPHPLTIVQIGLAHEAAGRGAEARASFERALAIAEATRGTTAVPRLTPRHAGEIAALAHDDSGDLVASGGADGQVMLWDPATGRLVRRLVADATGAVVDVAFSADGARVGALFDKGMVRIWNTVTGEPAGAGQLPVDDESRDVDGEVGLAPGLGAIAVARYDGALVLHGLDGAVLATAAAAGEGGAEEVRFSADGRRVAQVSSEQIRVYEVDGLRPVRTIERQGDDFTLEFPVALTADGAGLLVRRDGETPAVLHVDLATGRQRRLAGVDFGAGELELARDGARLLVVGSGNVTLYDAARGRKLRSIGGAGALMATASLHPDGDRLVAGDSEGTLRVFDARTGALVRIIGHDTWGINDVGFDAAGRRLALGSDHGAIQIWDIDGGGRRQLVGHWGWVVFAQFEASGRRLISGGKDQTLRTWDVDSGRQERLTRARLSGKGNQAVALSDDGALVVSMVDNLPEAGWTLRAVDIASGRARTSVARDDDRHPAVVAIDPARTLVAAGIAGSVRLLAIGAGGRPGEEVAAHGGTLSAIAFSRAGRLLATTSYRQDEGIRLWTVDRENRSLQPLRTLPGHATDSAVELLFLPGDRRLVSVGRDHQVILWDVDSGRALHTMVHDAVVTGAALTPGGRLATSSKDRTVRIWDLATGAPVGTLMPSRSRAWVVVSADGNVDGSADGASLLYWQVGDVELPGFVAWDRQQRAGLLRTLVGNRGGGL